MAVFPPIAPGCGGSEPLLTVTLNNFAADEPQVFLAETDIEPLVELAVALMELVVEEPIHPLGRPHVYDVAPVTGSMVYVFELPEQTVVLPLMAPGVDGVVLTAIDND